MRRFGLIGYPITYSFSPGYFAEKYEKEAIIDARYDLYPLEQIEEFKALSESGVRGINVTIPYKEAVIPYLDELSPAAQQIQAVNVIDFRDGKLIGYNSDTYGFRHSLIAMWEEQPERALVLGTGGAAKAVWYVLEQLGINYLKVSRGNGGDITYDDIDNQMIDAHRLVVNTTPLGMFPNVDACPALPYDALTADHFLYDLVYNPVKTLFLQRGEDRGCAIKNGLEMLELQADRAWEIWNT